MAEDDTTTNNAFSDAKTTVEDKSKQTTLKDSEKIKPKDITVDNNELLDDPSVAETTKTVAPDMSDAKQLDVDDYTQTPIDPKEGKLYDADTSATQKQKMQSLMQKGKVSEGAIMDITQGELSEAMAKADTAELDPRATGRYQLEQLFSTIEEGKPPPPWLSPAMRKVNSIMNARGLGSSSMKISYDFCY